MNSTNQHTADATAPAELRSTTSAGRLALVTGKGSGTLKTGRILDYLGKDDEQRKACSLHLSLMDRMGVKLDGFGDAVARLENL